MKIVTVQEMRQAEAAANAAGMSYSRMMDRAGSAVAQEITRRMSVQGRSVLVLVGPGNNGGDGLVVARYLHDSRARVEIYLSHEREARDANLRLVQERAIPVTLVQDTPALASLIAAAGKADAIVDALLGTGVARPIEGMLRAMLRAVHEVISKRGTPVPVFAVDLPSGLDADTGAIDAAALPADVTVTFAFPKRGHFLFPGAGYVGQLVVADIGIPDDLVQDAAIDLLDADMVRLLLPARPLDAHKGTFGKLLVVAGSANYTGAAYLAAMAAYRAGAGLVTLAIAGSLHPILAAKTSEVTFVPLPEAAPGALGEEALPQLAQVARGYDAVLIGCGLGLHPQTQSLVTRLVALVKDAEIPLLVDADGLNALAASPQWWKALPRRVALTPHPGEMARLSGLTAEQIAGDRFGVALRHATEWSSVVVLKGAHTIIAAPNGRAVVNPFANPALATAGSGDVLAGAVAGLLAQRVPPYAAALAGAYLHAAAGSIVSRNIGDSGMIASDLLTALPLARMMIRNREMTSGPQTTEVQNGGTT